MTIYIDNDYKCHTSPADGLTAVETDAFDGKCRQFIEGYRFVPAGETWTRKDGQVFSERWSHHGGIIVFFLNFKKWRKKNKPRLLKKLQQS